MEKILKEIDGAVKEQLKPNSLEEVLNDFKESSFRGMLIAQRCVNCAELILAIIPPDLAINAKNDPGFHIRFEKNSSVSSCPLCKNDFYMKFPDAMVLIDGSKHAWNLKHVEKITTLHRI